MKNLLYKTIATTSSFFASANVLLFLNISYQKINFNIFNTMKAFFIGYFLKIH